MSSLATGAVRNLKVVSVPTLISYRAVKKGGSLYSQKMSVISVKYKILLTKTVTKSL